ncbi:hypothetical protein NOF04DRAFT_1400624 [Fusarium oxysporum II5]|nr:hypothetical protein NOF04DRAFT_1400624 [Fusarium oxysporum II5]
MSNTRTIFQLDSQPTWFENITLRSGGTILATRLDIPEVWEIDPEKSTGSKILRIPFQMTSRTRHSLASVVSNLMSSRIWLADLAGEQAKVAKIADMPEIGMVNGIATWDENTALVTDCLYGKVYKLSVATGSYNVTLEDNTFTIPAEAPFQVGLNGIKVYRFSEQTYVYYTTTSRFCVYRVPVTQEVQAAGSVETLAPGLVADDFALARDGTMYVCTNISNTVVRIPATGGEAAVVAGEAKAFDVAGSTACVFGEDEGVLYVSTSGANAVPVDGKTEPAKIVEVKLN